MIWKYMIQVNGMMFGMYESHVNNAIRKAFPVKKVTSSRSRDCGNEIGRGCPVLGHSRHRL